MLLLLWTSLISAAQEPTIVPMLVPALPMVPVQLSGPYRANVYPLSLAIHRTSGEAYRLGLGLTIAQTPFERIEDQRCRCDERQLRCVLLDDGSISFQLSVPTIPRPEHILGTCTMEGRTFVVQAEVPQFPHPWEESPGSWILPYDAQVAPLIPIPLLWVKRYKHWQAAPGSPCDVIQGTRRGEGTIQVHTFEEDDGFYPCGSSRKGTSVRLRRVPFTLPWRQQSTPLAIPAP